MNSGYYLFWVKFLFAGSATFNFTDFTVYYK